MRTAATTAAATTAKLLALMMMMTSTGSSGRSRSVKKIRGSSSAYTRRVARAVEVGRRAGLLQPTDGPAATAASSDGDDQRMQQRADTASWLCELLQCTTAADKSRLLKLGSALVTKSPGDLRERLQHLVQLFGGDEAAAKQACRREPHLLTSSPEAIDSKVRSLGVLLTITSRKELISVVSRFPRLLTWSPDTLHNKVQAMSELLGSKDAAVRVCQKEPSLLTFDPTTLQCNAVELQQLLAGSPGQRAVGTSAEGPPFSAQAEA